jgi:hypothetical protein
MLELAVSVGVSAIAVAVLFEVEGAAESVDSTAQRAQLVMPYFFGEA